MIEATPRHARPGAEAIGLALDRLETVRARLRAYRSVVVALSGGIDSTLVFAVAAEELGPRCLGVTGDSAALPVWDREDAGAAARRAGASGARWRTTPTKELDDPRYASNPRSRCYFCKEELYGTLVRIAAEEGYVAVVDGTNADDLVATDRPGQAAAHRFGIGHPLAEAGMTKADVRAAARALGLEAWDRPASACLASRIPFGRRITPGRLRRVESAELAVRALGFRQVRVRDLDRGDARLEVEPSRVAELRQALEATDLALRLHELGFERLMVAPEGYRGGGAGQREGPPTIEAA